MELTDQQFKYVSDLVRREAAIVMPVGKEYLVESRLRPLVRKGGHGSITDLLNAAQGLGTAANGVRKQIVESLTINETSWFRDREPFAALIDVVLPALLKDVPARPIRIWSAASSSGQEAYSIAIQLDKTLPPGRDFQIFASDLSVEMVERTRAGVYNQLEINRGLPASDMVKYFERKGADWQVVDRLRRKVTVQQLNLSHPLPPMQPFDVVFLRNVLIYFSPETKRQILTRIRKILRPGGWLQLGAAETTVGIDSTFERIPVGRTAIYRAPIASRLPVKEVTAC
ncbi:CheR family methyltransferase [Actinophytocola xanthii]|uniref:protein-glutamate O-methyltransferase n=1 Tax=Actinophytocola xanthii TaxID=1912961 RepID=A0A1Q8BXR2_9PSEU|nr:protein-glutamate O-methyltransferase CheR [Actinophytocola xanthii]OLF06893.1 chemotaxis protein CheR [Actinophytocola xanthii]